MPLPKLPWPARRAAARRRGLEKDLHRTLTQLRANDSQFQLATDPFYLEQVIYEHAALMCRCSALLRELREGGAPCPPA